MTTTMTPTQDEIDAIIRKANELLERKWRSTWPTFYDEPKKCECGSDKAKLPTHSDWCPKSTER